MSELARCLSLPADTPPHTPVRSSGHYTLQPAQQEIINAAVYCGAAFGMVGVGHGKGLAVWLLPAATNERRALILSPASLIDELYAQRAKFREHFDLWDTPVGSYSLLSNNDFLEQAAPSLIICDEAHYLGNPDSTRTKRLLSYLGQHPRCRIVFLTGSPTTTSPRDYAHLLEACFGPYSPVPRDGPDLRSLHQCVSPDGDPGAWDWSRVSALGDDVRAGLLGLLRAHPGVVLTTDTTASHVRLDLIQRGLRVPDRVRELVRMVRGKHCTPDGAEYFASDSAEAICVKQLYCGFWYRWVWTNTKDKRRWLSARSEWYSAVRQELRVGGPGYDSPALVERAVGQEGTGELRATLDDWLAVKDLCKPQQEAVWVDDFMILDAVHWLRGGGIIWYQYKAVADALEKSGVRVFRAGQKRIEKVDCALSIPSHGTGLNLQAWRRQLITTPPSSGRRFEQLLGRTHRLGQEAESVEGHIYQYCAPFRRAYKAARADARYIEETTSQRQKLLHGNDARLPREDHRRT